MRMHVICVGLNYRTTPLALRERLSVALRDDTAPLIGRASEWVALVTCNRLEYYAASDAVPADGLAAAVQAQLRAAVPDAAPALEAGLYTFTNAAVAQHLGRVAAGLDSQVLGETQIQGQVSAAYRAAHAQGTTGPALTRLFDTALTAGKRVRSETALSQGATSLSTVALQAAARALPDLEGAHALVIGAGEMAGLMLPALRSHAVRTVTVANRTLARAQALATQWDAAWMAWPDLERALIDADLVVSATAAPEAVVPAALVAAAMQRRPDRPLVLIDLAVPRDIDPAVAQLPNVTYFDLDALNGDWQTGREARLAAVAPAEAIVAAEAGRYARWLDEWAARGLIAELHTKAELIRQAEVARTLRHLPDLSAAERAHVDALTKALLNRWLHEPTARLKAQSGSQAAAYSATLRDLFGLDETA